MNGILLTVIYGSSKGFFVADLPPLHSETLLAYPALFSGQKDVNTVDLASEYLDLVEQFPVGFQMVKAHFFAMLYPQFCGHCPLPPTFAPIYFMGLRPSRPVSHSCSIWRIDILITYTVLAVWKGIHPSENAYTSPPPWMGCLAGGSCWMIFVLGCWSSQKGSKLQRGGIGGVTKSSPWLVLELVAAVLAHPMETLFKWRTPNL